MRIGKLTLHTGLVSLFLSLTALTAAAQAPPKSAEELKVRPITAFINLDRAQYRQEIAEHAKMPN